MSYIEEVDGGEMWHTGHCQCTSFILFNFIFYSLYYNFGAELHKDFLHQMDEVTLNVVANNNS
jgi:hypothetical protein